VDSASVSPEFRNAALKALCIVNPSEQSEEEDINDFRLWMQGIYPHGTGTYPNEAERLLDNWEVEQWGSMERYNRLLSIKQEWDPHNLFECHHCVGDHEVDICSIP